MVDQGNNVTDTAIEPTAVEAPAQAEAPAPSLDFSKLLRDNGGPIPEQVVEEKGLKEEKQEEAPKAEADEQQAPAKDEQPVKASDKDRERALSALRRAKAPQGMIDKLDDPETLAWGLELATQQSEVDRRLSQSGQKANKEAGEQDAEPEASGTPAPDPMPEVEPFDIEAEAKSLEDDFGPDETKALASFVQKTQKAMQQQVEARVQAQVQPLQQQLAELLVDQTLREMVGSFPQLADKTQREAVRAKAAILYASGGYTEEGELLADACKLALDNQADPEASSRTLDLDRKRDGGTPEVPKGQNAAKPMSAEDKQRLQFRKILKKHS